MRIIGIDPGYARLGFGIIEVDGSRLRYLDAGCIETPAKQAFADRLLSISEAIHSLIEDYKPDIMAVEELFFANNKTTALGTAHARGAVLVEAARRGLEVYEYTPNQIKKAVTGSGKAIKQQVQMMVKVLLNLKQVPKPDDAADALAVAICQAYTGRLSSFEVYGGYQGKEARQRGTGRG